MIKNIIIIFLMFSILPVYGKVEEVWIDGSIDLDFIWSENVRDSDDSKKDQPAFVEGEIEIFIDARLSDGVKGFIELESSGNYNCLDADNMACDISQAYIDILGFPWDFVNFKIGKMDLAYNMRFDKSLRRNSRWLVDIEGALGIFCEMEYSEQIYLSGWWFKIEDNSFLENTSINGNTNDFDVWGINADMYWSQLNLLRGYFLYVQDRSILPENSNLDDGRQYWVLGAGSDFMFHDFEVYCELAYQYGKYYRTRNGHQPSIRAFGGYTGFEYTWIKWKGKPYFGMEALIQEGDQWDKKDSRLTRAGWQRDFSDFRKSLIFESYKTKQGEGWYDFDDDLYSHPYDSFSKRNDDDAILYFRIYGGWKSLSLIERPLSIDWLFTYFYDTDDTDKTTYGSNIGSEFDFIVNWDYTEDLVFSSGLGFFFPDEDFARNRWGTDAENDMVWKFVFNCTLKF